MKQRMLLLFFLTTAYVGGCSTGGSRDRLVIDELQVVEEGKSVIFKLGPGTYELDMTASNDGAMVEWVGSDCPKSAETNSLSTICKLTRTGQLIVSNPTGFGMGASVSVTIKVTRRAPTR